jgi:lipopolysaccharide export system permease protein
LPPPAPRAEPKGVRRVLAFRLLKLLHRYLFREVLFSTIVAVALFAFVLLGGTAIHDIVGYAASGQITVEQSAELIALLTPFVMTYALPFGLLTAVLLVLGRVSAQHEITAMRSAGVGLMQIGAPVMFIAVLGVCASLVINYVYAPRSKTLYRQILFDVSEANPVQLIVPGTFVRDIPQTVIFAAEKRENTLHDVWIWRMDDQHRVIQFYWFQRGSLNVDDAKNAMVLTADGLMQADLRREKAPEDFSRMPIVPSVEANGFQIEFPLGELFKRRVFAQKVAWMDYGELVAERRRLSGSDDPKDKERLQEVRVNLHEKGALAFSVFSFALIAVPLGIQTRRKETSANLGLALALILAFYFGMIAVSWLERRPDLRPDLLLWVPNIGFQLMGGWMWWRFGRN